VKAYRLPLTFVLGSVALAATSMLAVAVLLPAGMNAACQEVSVAWR